MRISLLLQREPFGEILCRTLERYLEAQDGVSRTVRWHHRRPAAAEPAESQRWLCNTYLNAIFLPRTSRSDLEPVIREFSRSPSLLRRLPQRAYVALATHPVGARFAADAYLEISPPVNGAEHWLIVGGNHKLRILDRPSDKATAMLKAGFDPRRFETEISMRRAAEQAGLPVPPLIRVSDDGTWFEERYVTGTPLNRLSDPSHAVEAVTRVGLLLARLSMDSREEATAGDYVAPLLKTCRRHIAETTVTSPKFRERIDGCIMSLERKLAGHAGQTVSSGLAHGDFQPANVLREGETVWLIGLGVRRTKAARGRRADLCAGPAPPERSRRSIEGIRRARAGRSAFDAVARGVVGDSRAARAVGVAARAARACPGARGKQTILVFLPRTRRPRSRRRARAMAAGCVKPKLLILNQMAGPVTWELAEDLAENVGPVELLTGHPDTLTKPPTPGISVSAATPYHRGSYLRRSLSWIRYLFQAFSWIRKRPADVPLLFFSNPPLSPWLGWVMNRLRGQQFAVMVHDIYPDVLVGLMGMSARNPLVRVWHFMNRRAYRRAKLVMTLGERMAQRLEEQCPGHSVEVVYPWADTNRIRPRPRDDNWFAAEHGLVGKLTVMYSGNMGIGHDIETILEAARRLRDRDEIRFVFIGSGPKWQLVDQARKSEDLSNVTLLGWQPDEVLPYSLPTADIAVVSLEVGLDGLAIPSKAFSFLAAGAALLVISREGSELADLVHKHECGWLVGPKDLDRFVDRVTDACSQPDRLRAAQSNSRRAAETLGSRRTRGRSSS